MEALNIKQLLAWQPPKTKPIISSGLLYPGTKMLIFGKYGTWKSNMAVDMGFKIASGADWAGYKTSCSRTLILQLEIPQMLFRTRIIKYLSGTELRPDNLYFIHEPYLKLDRDYGLSRLEATLSVIKPDVLIIDPLYQVLSGSISDSYAVGIFQGNMDKIASRHDLTLLFIAHSRQQVVSPDGTLLDMGADEIMGTSYWPDWFDTVLRINQTKDDTVIMLTFPRPPRHAERIMEPVKLQINRSNLQWKMVL